MKAARAVAAFDSSTGLLRGLSKYLAGQDLPLLGQVPGSLEPVLSSLLGGINRLPRSVAERVYALSGIAEAIPQSSLRQVDSEELAEWVVDHYPKRQYPVVFLGASNGALTHLAAALDAPWLPQTLLLPVHRHGVDRDDPRAELAAGRTPGRALLDANPNLRLHHMHDPNQDRLMIGGMSYFRVKWLSLPTAYRRFLREQLAPGGVVVSTECTLQWPATIVDDRHYFQFGALGGATEEEYFHGGPRVAELLRRYGASRRGWDPPEWDRRVPEAEWGFDPAWLADLDEVVRERGHAYRRLSFEHPEQLSPVVADVYENWYRMRGLPSTRALFDCFLLLEPWWTLRTGSIPFWLSFNAEPSLNSAHAFLDGKEAFDEIRLMLFSHGADSIGLSSIAEWEAVTERARELGSLVGVDRDAFPRDFAVFARAHRDLTRTPQLRPIPTRLSFEEADRLLRERTDVEWLDPAL